MGLRNQIRQSGLFAELSALEMGREGNLLQHTTDDVIDAQMDFLRWCFLHGDFTVFLETGTNKSLFGLFLSFVYSRIKRIDLHTFDRNGECRKGVEILNRGQDVVVSHFHFGDTRETLPEFDQGADFMWLDGRHNFEYVSFELVQANRLGIRWVAVDDTNIAEVFAAVTNHKLYRIAGNPFLVHDKRRPLLLERRT